MNRILFVAILIFLIDFLAFQAVRHLVAGSGKGMRITVYALFWLIPVLTLGFIALAAFDLDTSMSKSTRTIIRTVLFIFYFTKLLIAAIILMDDLRRLAFGAVNLSLDKDLPTSRSTFMTYGALILGALPFISLTYGMARNPYRYQVLRHRLRFKDLPPDLNGLKIVQISDIHSGSFLLREPVERSVDLILAEAPDIIFFTGDLVNSSAKEMEPFMEMFGRLAAPLGVYSILGNHDYGDYQFWPSPQDKIKNFNRLKETHRKLGWDLLLNEHRSMKVGATELQVIGVENYSSHPRFPKYGDLAKAAKGLSETGFKILLSHDPSHWDDEVIKRHTNIRLTLSGHTHGFQFGVDIPGFLKWSPVQYVYPRWAGLYQEGDQYLYVNRGLGYLGYPGRVGILPEITLITLEAA